MQRARRHIKLPEPWLSFLKDVDQALEQPVEIHCFGAFVLSALHELPRPTGDIDYLPLDGIGGAYLAQIAGRGSGLSKRHKLYFEPVGMADIPDNYEDRLIELRINLRHLKLFALEEYDLVLSKLTRNSPKDVSDVKFLAANQKLNFDQLYQRWESEMKPWIPNAPRHETTIQLWKEYFPI